MVTTASHHRKRPKRRTHPLLILMACFSVLFSFAIASDGQVKQSPARPAAATQEGSWPKWNFAFTAPSVWRQYMEHIDDNNKVPNGAHEETRYFTRTPDRPNVYPHSDLTITFTTWPGPE